FGLNKQISIIGCGWLSLPLAKQLIENGYFVKGTTTSVEKLALLKSVGIEPYSLNISEHAVEGNMNDVLHLSDIVIINIPPGLRKNTDANFVKRIRNVIPYLATSDHSEAI